MAIEWQYYPKSDKATESLLDLLKVFEAHEHEISSGSYSLPSNSVLALLAPDLRAAGYRVELGKKSGERVHVPVLFGRNGKLEKYFDAFVYVANWGTREFYISPPAGIGRLQVAQGHGPRRDRAGAQNREIRDR